MLVPGTGFAFWKAPVMALSTWAGVQSSGKNELSPPLPFFGFQAPCGGFSVGSKTPVWRCRPRSWDP